MSQILCSRKTPPTRPQTVHNLIFILLLWKDRIYKIHMNMINMIQHYFRHTNPVQKSCGDLELSVKAIGGLCWCNLIFHYLLSTPGEGCFPQPHTSRNVSSEGTQTPPLSLSHVPLMYIVLSHLQPYHIYSDENRKK